MRLNSRKPRINHPGFQRNNNGYNPNPGEVGNFTGLGDLGMQPRFDPYSPPGDGRGRFGQVEVVVVMVGGRGRGRGSIDCSGDPYPNHETPNILSIIMICSFGLHRTLSRHER
jgi:hypothetical protein